MAAGARLTIYLTEGERVGLRQIERDTACSASFIMRILLRQKLGFSAPDLTTGNSHLQPHTPTHIHIPPSDDKVRP